MGISIDITANAKSFVDAAGQAGASLSEITDALKFIQENADISDANLQKLFADTIAKAEAAGDASQQAYNRGTASVREMTSALQQQERQLAETQSQYERLAGTPAVLDETLAKNGQAAEESGEKIQESGKLGEAALMNLGFSSMQAGSLFTGGLSGMAEQAGTFAAFMGPSLAGVAGAASGIAWPLTIAGVALAAIGGLMQADTQDAQQLSQAVTDYVNAALGTSEGSDAMDEGIRKWAKSASDYGGVSLTDLQDDLKGTSIRFGDVASAIATQSVPKMEQQKKAIDDLAKAIDDGFVPSSNVTSDGLRKVSAALKTNIDQQNLYKDTLKAVAAQQHETVAQYQLNEKAVEAEKKAQQDWNTTIQQGFDSAAEASGDWAASTKVDLNQVANNLNEYNAMIARLPADEIAATKAGLSGAGLAYIESLPNGPEILDQMALDPGSPGAQALIAAANQTGQNIGKSTNDGVDAAGDPKTKTIKYIADTHEVEATLARLNGQTIYVDVKNRNGNRIV